MDASYHSSTILGRFVCAVVMLPVHAGETRNRGNSRISIHGSANALALFTHISRMRAQADPKDFV